MWFDDSGRMQLCETGIDGFKEEKPIKPCHASISGYTIQNKK